MRPNHTSSIRTPPTRYSQAAAGTGAIRPSSSSSVPLAASYVTEPGRGGTADRT